MTRSRAIGLGIALAMLFQLAWAPGESVAANAGERPDAASVPDAALMLDTADPGVVIHLTDLGEGPYVVVPIFTRCRAVCTLVAKRLKAAWGERGPEVAAAQVVLASFDPEDTQADMAHFRELFELPSSWHLATLEREEGLGFFSGLGFQWRTLTGRQFDHSGKIFVLTDELRIASVLGADQLTTDRLRAEIASAKTGASLARRIGTHWVGFFGVGLVLLILVVAVTWDKVWSRRRAVSSP